MAFTSPELVRTHLSNVRLGETAIADLPVVLNGTETVQLPHTGLVAGSVVVTSRRATAPTQESKSLAAAWVGLSYAHLVPETVVVAKDSSLGTLYFENIDFIVDYAGGRIKRIPGGSITSGQTVVIWYEYYHVYVLGDDYTVNEATGQLTRRSTGAIADGQTVRLDYIVALGTVSDDVIERAIAETAETVLSLIDPSYQDQPTDGIVIGATHWAVAAVCRMRAGATLADNAITAGAARTAAQTWLGLSTEYDRTGRDHLSRFAAPVPTLQPPRRN